MRFFIAFMMFAVVGFSFAQDTKTYTPPKEAVKHYEKLSKEINKQKAQQPKTERLYEDSKYKKDLVTELQLRRQNRKTELTLEEAVLEQHKSLAPETLNGLQWVKNSSEFSYIKKSGEEEFLTLVDREERVFMSLSDLNKKLEEKKEKKLKSFPKIYWLSKGAFRFTNKSKIWKYSVDGGLDLLLEMPNGSNKDYHENSNKVAYTRNNGFYIADVNGEQLVLADSAEGVVLGQAVHRYEFGISKGTFWSPNGEAIAFYRKDESMVTTYPLLNLDSRPANADLYRYPMAGNASHDVSVGIYNTASKKMVWLKTDDTADFYKTNIAWSEDGSEVFVALLNRGQDTLHIKAYNSISGDFKYVLHSEFSKHYVEPEHPVESLGGGKYLFRSEKGGYEQYWILEKGKPARQLMKAEINVTKQLGIDQSKKYLIFEGIGVDAVNKYLYKLNLRSGKVTKLNAAEGWHSGIYNEFSEELIDRYSNSTLPNKIVRYSVRSSNSKKVLLEAKDPLEKKVLGNIEIGELMNEGVKLYTRTIYPSDFDSTKKYPVLLYVYNGPHVQLVQNRWLGAASLWMFYMAEQGYIVLSVDGRGSANRSLEFEQVIHRSLGDAEMRDQLAAVGRLKEKSFVDSKRIAVHGWSFGGFMTTSLMTRYAGKFNVGVAGGPVIDWSMYEIMYTERYMDAPSENPEGYKKNSLFQYVKNLERPLLMIHGVVDDVVLMQHSLEYVKACVDEGVQLDYFVYPGHPHNVRGKDRVHLMQKVLDYIQLHNN